MTNKEIVEWLREKKCNMFATHNNINEIPLKYSGAEKTVASIVVGITLNTVLEGLAQEILKKEDS